MANLTTITTVLLLFTALLALQSAPSRAAELEEVGFRQGEIDTPSDELEFVRKRASNLGSRMCRLDSRNCGAFNMGKKFGGYSWLRSADSTRRRLEYYLASKWQRGEDTPRYIQGDANEYWQGSDN